MIWSRCKPGQGHGCALLADPSRQGLFWSGRGVVWDWGWRCAQLVVVGRSHRACGLQAIVGARKADWPAATFQILLCGLRAQITVCPWCGGFCIVVVVWWKQGQDPLAGLVRLKEQVAKWSHFINLNYCLSLSGMKYCLYCSHWTASLGKGLKPEITLRPFGHLCIMVICVFLQSGQCTRMVRALAGALKENWFYQYTQLTKCTDRFM